MAEPVTIIATDFDDLQVERIFVADADGRPEMRATISGVECLVDTKDTLLDAGLVYCRPTSIALQDNWPVYSDLMVNGVQDRYWGVAAEPRLVTAARRFASLLAVDEARPGMAL